MSGRGGRLWIVGIGPGDAAQMTVRAREVLDGCEVIVGYAAYLDLLGGFTAGKTVVRDGMGGEVRRCEAALDAALQGRRVALVSSGDAGLYGMAGLVLEIAHARGGIDPGLIETVPGVPAFIAAAALAGAPLMNDCACISLSDLLNPWEAIERKLRAAALGDFVACLYNPKSTRRTAAIEAARAIFLEYRAPQTPCAIIRNAYRDRQSLVRTSLQSLPDNPLDMFCLVIIGSSRTRFDGPWMVTPRGYAIPAG
jgi:precorrin-3B C17-methyltransferase